jgi:hypothetical protein
MVYWEKYLTGIIIVSNHISSSMIPNSLNFKTIL